MGIIKKIKSSKRDFYLLYADMTDLLEKAQKALRPLPEECKLVRLTKNDKGRYKCQWNMNQILSDEVDEAWAVLDRNGEIVAYHHGTYRGKKSMFFKVRNCDYEHTEIMVDERFRRKGLAVHLLYCAVKNLDSEKIRNHKIGTMIKPDNIPSIKLHELIGFKKTRRVRLFHKARIKDNKFTYLNFPVYKI